MRRWQTRGAAALAVLWGLVSSAGAAETAALDAALETSRGAPVRLASRLGRPTVLFYEDRDSTELNRALKTALTDARRQPGSGDFQILAVADLEGYGGFIARGFALGAVQEAEAKAGLQILVDWNGALGAPPWELRRRTSTVVLIDAERRIVSKASGRLSTGAREALLAALSRLVAGTRTAPTSER